MTPNPTPTAAPPQQITPALYEQAVDAAELWKAEHDRVEGELRAVKLRAKGAFQQKEQELAKLKGQLERTQKARDVALERVRALELELNPPEAPTVPEAVTEGRYTRGFNAPSMAGASAAVNKTLMSAIRGSGLRSVGGSYVTTGETWHPDASPDCGDVRFAIGWDWGGNVSLDDLADKAGNIDYERCLFDGRESDHPRGAKWGLRRYNLGDTYVGTCDFLDIGREHGIYDNLGGHGLYRDLTFSGIGSQAIQIAYRDQPYQQYPADNAPFTKPPVIVLEDCHAVDAGEGGSRPGFVYSFFDPGTAANPGIVVMRGCTSVSQFETARLPGTYEEVPVGTPKSIRSSKGFVVQQFQQRGDGRATKWFVQDSCAFDHTEADGPLGAVRGVENILFSRSTYLNRGDARQRYVDIDDDPQANDSKYVVLHDTHSDPDAPVMLRVRRKTITTMHQPGRLLLIDVEAGEIVLNIRIENFNAELWPLELTPDEAARIKSPLDYKVGTVKPGFNPQPPGAVEDAPAAPLQFYERIN